MRCSGCGKDIPFNGDVCPHCQRDKGADQVQHAITVVLIVVGMGIGWLVSDFKGMLWGGTVAVVLAIVIGVADAAKRGPTKPPQVRVAPESSPPPAPAPTAKTVQQRLAELDMLRKEGLITEGEYAAKRQAILDRL